MPAAAPVQTLTIGDIRVTYLPDGETRLAPTAFFPASTDEGWALHPDGWTTKDVCSPASAGS